MVILGRNPIEFCKRILYNLKKEIKECFFKWLLMHVLSNV